MARDEAAEYLRVSTRTLSRWPVPASVVGRVVLYDRADLDQFVREHRVVRQAGMTLGVPARTIAQIEGRSGKRPSAKMAQRLIDILQA